MQSIKKHTCDPSKFISAYTAKINDTLTLNRVFFARTDANLNTFKPVLWIRICMDLHNFGNLDLHPDPHPHMEFEPI
jgi:hypothetical protein